MKKNLIACFATAAALLLTAIGSNSVAAPGSNGKNRYDVEYVKSVGSGVDCVKVWSYSRNKKESVETSKKNAVHAVIFRGYSGAGASKRPLARDVNAENTYIDFFNEFFKGEYSRFVSSVGERSLVKVGKDYKIGEEVVVNTGELRRYLEGHGVIKSLNSGF